MLDQSPPDVSSSSLPFLRRALSAVKESRSNPQIYERQRELENMTSLSSQIERQESMEKLGNSGVIVGMNRTNLQEYMNHWVKMLAAAIPTTPEAFESERTS